MSQEQVNKRGTLGLPAASRNDLVCVVEIEKVQSRRLTLGEARRKALEGSEKAKKAQIDFAENDARRWYDYKDIE